MVPSHYLVDILALMPCIEIWERDVLALDPIIGDEARVGVA